MVRMKVALALIIILFAVIPYLALNIVGDGSLLGRLQTFSSYALSLVSLILCLLTVTLSCFALSGDIKGMQIFNLITKPVARYEILLGKFCGVMLLNTAFLVLFSGLVYLITMNIPRFTSPDRDELARANDEFYIARTAVLADFDEKAFKLKARDDYYRLRELEQLPRENMTLDQFVKGAVSRMKYGESSVADGEVKRWTFRNIKPKAGDNYIYLRFKLEASSSPPDNMISGRWVVGDLRQMDNPQKEQTPIYDSYLRRDAIKVSHELKIPSSTVASDGIVNVEFQNVYNGTTIIPQEIEVLYRSGSFGANFFKANLLILVRLFFLTALGVALTTWLSFPVAFFVAVVIYITGSVHGFIFEAIDDLGTQAGIVYALTVKPLLYIMPSFDGDSTPAAMILSARMISWLYIFKMFAITAVIKGGAMLGLGALIFNKREVAKVTV
jgi:hypothetical protein